MPRTKKKQSKNSLGTIKINSNKLWGSTTQRNINKFSMGKESVDYNFIKSIILIKKAINLVNIDNHDIDNHTGNIINTSCNKLLKNNYLEHFPLKIWQCGSGTQINMNVNEVIANLANKNSKNKKKRIDPNDHINIFQSTNDVMPSAMNITIIRETRNKLDKSLKLLQKIIKQKIIKFKNIVKLGKTHLKDAVPISFAQEYSGYLSQINQSRNEINRTLKNLYYIPMGGTCVGTGLNTKDNFDKKVVAKLNNISGLNLKVSRNKFKDISTHDDILTYTSALNRLAVSLIKISNDINLASSGPISGFNEIIMPINEIGSSSMPGKFNNSTCEMISSLALKTINVHQLVTSALTHSYFQLNVYKPLIINEILNIINLLSEGITIFSLHTLKHIKPNTEKTKSNLDSSFVKYTKLTPILGYQFLSNLYQKSKKNKKINIEKEILKTKLLTKKQLVNLLTPNNLIKPIKNL